MTIEDFTKLGIEGSILQVIEEQGFVSPTKIQNKAIPEVYAGKNIIATAATGSGKTLVFATRVLQIARPGYGLQAIIMVPTRELAQQVGEQFKLFAKYKPLNIMITYGGANVKTQKEDLQNVDVLIGTPGRISDFLEQDLFLVGKVKCVVLDEVDAMIRNEFQADIKFILETTPKKKQTLVFSATIDKEMYKLLKNTIKDSKLIAVERTVDPRKLKQNYYKVDKESKFSLLSHIVEQERAGLSIIFVNRQDYAEFLIKNLRKTNPSLHFEAIHSDMTQGKRNRLIRDFASQKFDILITTDMAARGLDIEGVTHIYNYQLPSHTEKYIHRIGRTARAGASGKVINLVTDDEVQRLTEIVKSHKISVMEKELPHFDIIVPKFQIKKKVEKR
jgi:ATP-dependent RNA helicase DeaD